ncbi:MAG: 10 TM acyl transferase domain found in Cas1p-domain-containing protein [Benjaminiella poitrasii]|nr:MAG: 10 TM acyl transferase domain found in Cas1p-domain-containing protein [Benjaminiella poitrasii]
MHTYKAPEVARCLGHARIVYVGDSIVRQQYFAALKLIRPNVDTTTDEPHANRKFVFQEEHLTMEFWWDPYLNETLPTFVEIPSLLVMGTGAWQMRYLNEDDYFETWKASVDRVVDAAERQMIAEALLISPVEIPDYSRLSVDRAQTMTLEKVQKMNDYLADLQTRLQTMKTPAAVPFAWNRVAMQTPNATGDGLHYSPHIALTQTQIALNYRCNDQVLNKAFPMDTTCCFTYPTPRWYQLFFIAFFFVYLPLGYLMKNSQNNSKTVKMIFPSKKILDASFIFGLCVIYMYYGDRTQLFGKIHKHFDPTVFAGMMIAVAVMGMVQLEHHKKEGGDEGFLNRHQTDEWKGWMQVIILVYHFCGASGTSGIYNAVRVLVAAYLFQTGYGHFFFFYKKADFGIGRILNVMVRLNLLTFVLQYLMNTDYLSYYFTPLVSFWFLVIWITMYIGHRWNKIAVFMVAKLLIACCFTTTFIHVPGVLETVFNVLEVLANIKWDASEWRFRLGLDAYIVYVGMLTAFIFIKMTEHQVMNHPRWPNVRQATLIVSACAMVGYFWYELTRENKFVYNKSHPFISWIPILAFVFLRNGSVYLRNTHSKFYAFIGKISLETFIGQFHMWLAGDTKGLLVVLTQPWWVNGAGWWINLIISTSLFIFVCYYMSQTTHDLTVSICQNLNQSITSTKNSADQQKGEYQAMPLLPTSSSKVNNLHLPTADKNNENIEHLPRKEELEEEEEEEVWEDLVINETKPTLIKRIVNDTRVKVLTFIIFIALLNHFC